MADQSPRENNSLTAKTAGTPPPGTEQEASWPTRLILPAIFTVLVILILRSVFRIDGWESLWKIAVVLLGLGFVIFFHELGHFLVAKWCDVHVQVFSIGFGPALPGCSFQWGETLYKIALFPLGGYVKMVGEGADEEDNADDPRSFKKKSVGQRMAIISAGVIMNVILAAICFSVVYEMHGVRRHPAEVAAVEAGSPTWRTGIPSGSRIEQIDNVKQPYLYFEDLQAIVMHSQAGEEVKLVYQPRPLSDQPRTVEIKPRFQEGDDQPIIGMSPPDELQLMVKEGRKKKQPPVLVDSAANHASPAFEFGDQIIATTDPDDPAKITELPPNPFYPDLKDYYDYYTFYERLVRLRGKPMVVQVRRAKAAPDTPPVNILIPPSYHYTFGLRMHMGQITAVRDGSEAAKGLDLPNATTKTKGDIIKQVEVVDASGNKVRFVTARGKTPANDHVKEVDVDPMRLRYELERWAQERKGAKTVALTVFRGEEHKEVTVQLPWDESWTFDREVHISRSSPMSIPELGLAYQVECRVDEVKPGSPAAEAGLKEHDVIKAVCFQDWDADKGQAVPGADWFDLNDDQWAWCFTALQRDDFKQVAFRVQRDNKPLEQPVSVSAEEDRSWPLAERGLILMPDNHLLQKADGPGSAIAMGFHETYNIIIQTLQHIRSMITGRVKITRSFNGPVGIAAIAYQVAGEGFFKFLFFLGLISVSLAVINFLPIPLLDGGHMAFLSYEWVRGKPAPEQVQAAFMYLGLLIILSLMIFAFYVDSQHWNIGRFLFGK
jgi:regulator of sigma E protease